jgi:uncharacterized protein (DUF1330 family)
MSGHVDPTKEQFAAFMGLPREGAIHMLNLIRLRARAAYPDGREATGLEAYKTYARATGKILQRIGARQYWVGKPELTLIGPAEERWDLVFVVEYPSPEALAGMLRDPEYRNIVGHRQAAVEDSRLIRLRPSTPAELFGE